VVISWELGRYFTNLKEPKKDEKDNGKKKAGCGGWVEEEGGKGEGASWQEWVIHFSFDHTQLLNLTHFHHPQLPPALKLNIVKCRFVLSRKHPYTSLLYLLPSVTPLRGCRNLALTSFRATIDTTSPANKITAILPAKFVMQRKVRMKLEFPVGGDEELSWDPCQLPLSTAIGRWMPL
jgi:hypothetical protein